MILRRTALIVVHLAVALAIIGGLLEQRRSRTQAVAEIRAVADAEHRETARLVSDHAARKQILTGLREHDPYVVELLARDRLGYTRAGEIAPPPAPTPTP